ncbi:MAG: aldehyde dehydrogenase [Rhodospirillaceae bacterium]|jgi:(Z)-2-((N-methylformamido)methylene)-5-hydroxybutyrolactone dehydrogenase|nr:aldehyde dehydrogenase [Rhodospirillaceae bacterium]MBT5566388.1 aldehyde dehydrogenase [Rhodospirillaceae bacterium]MBT7450690.1 aldehyde dehydrogenase [Rhodospirillaceae bacterium]
MHKYQMYIGGKWCDSASKEWIETVNPYSGEVWAQIPKGTAADVDAAVSAADTAFRSSEWRSLTATQRGKLLCRFGDILAENAEALAEIEVRDNGKLYAEVVNQCRYMTQWFQYYGGLADKIEGSVPPIDKPNILNLTKHEPLGVCACITPWNSPLLLLAWKAAPALAAGNTIVIKPSEYTSASTLEFARISEEAGFPPGVINVITGLGADVGEALVRHDKVRKVAFTGGEEGGKRVNLAAADDFTRVTLELGGKSANIVFDDADMDQAVSGAISGIFAASGQTCIAGSRLLLQDSIHDEFLERLLDMAGQARIGDPMNPETQVGPITTEPQYRKIMDYIEIAKGEGAVCVMGGDSAPAPDGNKGLFVQPTVFSGVTNDMRIAQEEVFGPVLSVLRFTDEEHAIEIANDIKYGLAAGIWTQNLKRAITVSDRLEAGTVWVNTYRSTSYTTPFGGYKASGLGRENGMEAIKEYLQTKSIWLSTGSSVANPYMRR